MKLGYARVSRTDQNLDPQIGELKTAGVDRIFTDKLSGSINKRQGFEDLLDRARAGDVVIVCRLDRLARSLPNLLEIAATLERRSVNLISLGESIDTTTTAGKLVFQIFGAIAEFERNLIIDRTNAGLKAARAQGRVGGRKPALSDKAFKTALRMIQNGRKKRKDETELFREIAGVLHVSERTIRRVASGEYKIKKAEISTNGN